jgi:hypothetical protein
VRPELLAGLMRDLLDFMSDSDEEDE